LKFKLFGRTIEIKNSIGSLPPLPNDEVWRHYLAAKGYSVSRTTALQVAAVIRCVDVVAKTMASLPLNLYQVTATGREKAEKHRLYKLLHRLPNPETTAYEFWHMYVFNLMLTTGAYARIKRDQNGFITELWNIPTGNVSMRRNSATGERYINVYNESDLQGKWGLADTLYEGYFMFTPGLRFASITNPEDPIKIAREVLGLTMALNAYARDFFENGSNLGGFLESPGRLSDEAYQRFKESWQQTYEGVKNQHKIGILEEGLKYNPAGRNPKDSQAIESRKFAVTEVCRVFGVPPHKVFDLERATFSNIEQQNIEYVQESIAPMAVRIEQTIYKDTLTAPEQMRYFAKFSVNALLRGDIAARTAYYHNGRNDGWLNSNDIRELEDMNRIPAEQGGDEYAVNGNMIPLKSIPQNLPKGAKQ
jgi:HK97 family phage portal protein